MRIQGFLLKSVATAFLALSAHTNPNPYATLEEAKKAKAELEGNGPQGVETVIFLVDSKYFVTTKSAARKSAILKDYMQRLSTKAPIRVEKIEAQKFSTAVHFLEMFRGGQGAAEWSNTAYRKIRESNLNNLFNLIGVAQALRIDAMLDICLEIHARLSQELIRSRHADRFPDFVRRLEAVLSPMERKKAVIGLLPDWSRLVSKVANFKLEAMVSAIDVNPRGDRIAFGLKNGVVEIWQKWTDKKPLFVSRLKLNGEVSALSFCPKEDCIFTASGKLAQVWKSGRIVDDIFSFRASSDITSIAQSHNGDFIAFAKADGMASLFTVKDHTPRPYKEVRHGFFVTGVAFSTDGNYLATAGNENLKLWALDNLEKPLNNYLHGGGVSSLAFSEDNQWLVTGSRNHRAQVWRVEEAINPQTVLLLQHNLPVESVAFSPGSEFIATGMMGEAPLLWTTEPSKKPKPITLNQIGSDSHFVRFSNDGRFLLTTPRLNEVVVVSLPDLNRIDLIAAHIMKIVIAHDSHDTRALPDNLRELLARNPYAMELLFNEAQ